MHAQGVKEIVVFSFIKYADLSRPHHRSIKPCLKCPAAQKVDLDLPNISLNLKNFPPRCYMHIRMYLNRKRVVQRIQIMSNGIAE